MSTSVRRRTAARAAVTATLAALLLAPAAGALAAPAGAPVAVQAVAKSPAQKAKKGEFVRDVKLAGGWKGELYKAGARHHRLDIVDGRQVLGSVEANGRDGGLDANGVGIVLTPGGQIDSWTGGWRHGNGTYLLPDGSKAEVTRMKGLHSRMEITSGGHVLARLDANGHDAGLDANGMYIVLTADGQFSAHIPR
ncbi:hypothetical protein I5Q34_11065 [Streptomyces sp. AV19]|uniref:hypothetical protein n=1 Tax=Streptomyces sp. AV19 TaxID=2793068 RepID=UPI0018FE4967|nr:hypothetical protein [Streptomyces sp. AV19]MBH1934811.1 hypothetical protein [Streptomyces sp. AV19]MDG4530584.1 hypothetical protein [Streptomyces sp. AV19]